MYYISQVDRFSHPAFSAILSNPFVTTLASYSAVAFLTFFPVVMLTPIRRWWIAAGVCFHLMIAVSMGLVTFAAVMIGVELFMLTDAEHGDLWARLKRLSAPPASPASREAGG